MTLDLQTAIDGAWENRAFLTPTDAPSETREAVEHTLDALDSGRLRVAEKIDGEWITHQWIKKAVLLSFRLQENTLMGQSPQVYWDKVPLKFDGFGENGGGCRGQAAVLPVQRLGVGDCARPHWRGQSGIALQGVPQRA